ncbi:hypothetical protein EQ718_25965 (plasmid) [Paracoccus versutus]|uniref:Uncharacterized protein n=1 Tax=Paracoccus versutus TaxID=34007 RepID=A0AAQ0KLL6_PARVE|nr:hypothetical protein [Paracoccus versutus]REG46997.1 hypothetical protein ATH84_101215 [Paracoccus versutus]WEJ82230.1 hypothetical protein EQ718_25965 [Paracoccus versutus]
MKRIFLSLACAAALATPVHAEDSALLIPPRDGWPLANPMAAAEIAPPPFSLPTERGVNPAYVAGLPGLHQGLETFDDFDRRSLKHDSVLIRQSRVENGEVVIPPGGLAYLEDSWGGEVALRGEKVPILGRTATYIDYDMTVVMHRDVTIPAGQAVAVGGTVYHYYASIGHEQMVNHTLHVRTISGLDWEWAFGSPAFSTTEPNWWGNSFAQLYNQGKLREMSREALVFDWLAGVRMDRMTYAETEVFKGLAAPGDAWTMGGQTLRVAAVDEAAGTATVELVEAGAVVAAKTLGPVLSDRLIEDHDARKALVFEHGDVVAFLSPWPAAFEGGKVSLKVYDDAFAFDYGADFARDPRFAVWPVTCPTGHAFGFMLTNKQEIRLKPGQSVDGPEGYFKVVVNSVEGDHVTSWHVEDRQGNRSADLGGPQIANVDLVLGQGRVTGQSIFKDLGRALLARSYGTQVALETLARPEGGMAPAPAAAPMTASVVPVPAGAPLSPALLLALAVAVIASGAIGYELARRRGG